MKTIRIGSGAGYSGDRIEPAVELAEKGGIAYLVFECLAERTIAIAQQAKRADPAAGYDPLLAARMEACLPVCRRNGVRIVTNMGAANPASAAAKIRDIAGRLGLRGLKIAAVTGDDVLEIIRRDDPVILETGARLSTLGERLVSANAYLGAAPIAEALRGGADVVVTGRVADPSLFLAPLLFEFGWREDQWDLLMLNLSKPLSMYPAKNIFRVSLCQPRALTTYIINPPPITPRTKCQICANPIASRTQRSASNKINHIRPPLASYRLLFIGKKRQVAFVGYIKLFQ